MMVGDEKEEFMSVEIRSAIDFYEHHPISSEIILAKLNAVGDISMALRLKNYFHMTRIITEDWKLMTRWLHVRPACH